MAELIGEHIQCRLCLTFWAPPVPVVGDTPRQTVQRIALSMALHLKTIHPEVAQELARQSALALQGFGGLLLLMQFETNIPGVREEFQFLQKWMRNFTEDQPELKLFTMGENGNGTQY